MGILSSTTGICRLCNRGLDTSARYGSGIKYGPRHKAHVACAVERRGWPWLLERLTPWQAAIAGGIAYRIAVKNGYDYGETGYGATGTATLGEVAPDAD